MESEFNNELKKKTTTLDYPENGAQFLYGLYEPKCTKKKLKKTLVRPKKWSPEVTKNLLSWTKNFVSLVSLRISSTKPKTRPKTPKQKKLNSALSIRDAGKRNKEICFLK